MFTAFYAIPRFFRWAFAIIGAAIVAALIFFSVGGNPKETAADEKASSTTTTVVAGQQKMREAVSKHLREQGFKEADWVWEEKFDLSLPGASDAGDGSFSRDFITSREKLVSSLASNEPGPKAAREHVLSKVSERDRERVLNGQGYIGVQFLVPTYWAGNSLFDGNGVSPSGSVRYTAKGDIAWIFVGSDGKVVVEATLRGPCKNPQFAPPSPKPPPTTVPPGTTPTTRPPGTTPTTKPPTTTTTRPPPTTVPPGTTPTTRPPRTTTTVCESGKCDPPTTVAPPPVTAAPPATSATTLPPSDSGDGAYNTIPPSQVPTTVAPPAGPPATVSPPTSRVTF